MRQWLRVDPAAIDPAAIDPRYDARISGGYDLVNETGSPTVGTYWQRFSENTPRFVSGLLWEPLARSRPTRPYTDAAGWVVVACAVGGAAVGWRRRDWLALGAFGYFLPLLATWPDPIHRYLLPVAPALFHAAVVGARPVLAPVARLFRPAWPRRVAGAAMCAIAWGIAGSAAALNLGLYAMEVRIARSGTEFYERYDAGLYASLNDIGLWLRLNASPLVEVAASQGRYRIGSEPFWTEGHWRALNFLADRPIVAAPRDKSWLPTRPFIDWAEAHNVRYYVLQTPYRQVLHYRALPGDPKLRRYLKEFQGFRLFLIRRGKAKEIPLGEKFRPTAVPGLGSDRALLPWPSVAPPVAERAVREARP